MVGCMSRYRRRFLIYVALVAVAILLYTTAYAWAMHALEGRPRTILDSLIVVLETLTTVGYGEDAPWDHPLTQLLVIGMQLSAVLLVFAALPLVLIPYLEERIAVSPPDSVEMAAHVVVCGFGSRGRALVEELVNEGVEYVVVTDTETATALTKDGYQAIDGDPESESDLRRASVSTARAVVIDAGDERNAAIALAAGEVAPHVQTISYVEDPSLREYLEYAGVDRVLSPRRLLARALADRATSALTTRLGRPIEIGEGYELLEMPVDEACSLDGVTLGESGIRERTGANVVGAWSAGDFVSAPGPEYEIDGDTVLVVAGSHKALSELKQLTLSPEREGAERVVIAGSGRVGSRARQSMTAAGLQVTTIDTEEKPGVDIVGDATERGTLREAGLSDASALVCALPDDTDTVFTTLLARQLDEEVEILCRAQDEERVGTIYSAGADFALALGTISGRMLAATLLDEDILGLDTRLEVVRVQTSEFEGETLDSAGIRERTGCTVIAVQRDGRLVTGPDPEFTFDRDDTLIVAGTGAGIRQFNELADVGRTAHRTAKEER